MDKKSKKKFYCKNQNVKDKRKDDLTGKKTKTFFCIFFNIF